MMTDRVRITELEAALADRDARIAVMVEAIIALANPGSSKFAHLKNVDLRFALAQGGAKRL